jgi:hypothetical protein
MSDIPYWQKLLDPRWQRKRLEILNRDDFTCLDCGAKEATLHVHHCVYVKGGEPWDPPEEELRTLCNLCHLKRHDLESDLKLEFQRFMAFLTNEDLVGLMPDIICAKMAARKGVKPLHANPFH